MPPPTKPLPPELLDWVASKHPGYRVKLIEDEYVTSDAWNGTVYRFSLRQPGVPKSVAYLEVCAFALDQFHPSPEWTWEFLGPRTPDAKSAVLKALRNST
jgi:hypothetical protein